VQLLGGIGSRKGESVLREKSFTVFVVDDDDSIRKALRRLLSANGYIVMTFESAEDFLLYDRARTEGCIVLDIRFPGMSGLDLSEKLASSGANYPVIFITAQDNPEWQKMAAETGAVAYLRKPFDEQSLLDALHAASSTFDAVRTNGGHD
jgi:FixJ family two-component response regulator